MDDQHSSLIGPARNRAEAAATPLLRLDGVTKRFTHPDGRVSTALDRLSLDLPDQSFVALIGPSGCGKTTLLRLANGLISPDEGRVELRGAPPKPGPIAGFVFQNFRLIPWATVRGNVEFAIEQLPLTPTERRERAAHYLDLVGLSPVAGGYPAQLSGGMKQRVALARALAVEPDILLMDEPFASLDAQTRELMQNELTAIWERRRSLVLFVTHSIDEALTLADRILLMGSGRILESHEVDLPRPRFAPRLRQDPLYTRLHDHLWNRLRDLVLSDPESEFHGRPAEGVAGGPRPPSPKA